LKYYLKVSLVNINKMSDNENEDFSDKDSDIEEENESSSEEDSDTEKPKPLVIKNIDAIMGDDEEEDEDEDAIIHVGGSEDEVDEDDSDEDDPDDMKNDEDEEDGKVSNKKITKAKKPITIEQNLALANINDDEDDDMDDADEDETYLQKFDRDINKNYITDFHPECLIHNYDEISKLTKIIRDNDNNIIDPLHKTIPYLTKYEKTRILGQRAKQIECGAKPFVKVPENIIDSQIIAELELQEHKIPFIIRRPIPGGGCEYWNLKDLERIGF